MKTNKAITYLFIAISIIISTLIILDTIKIMMDNSEHRVSQKRIEDQHQTFMSWDSKYIFENVLLLLVFLSFIYIGFKKISNPKFNLLFYLCLFILLLIIIYGYWNWFSSGFEH